MQSLRITLTLAVELASPAEFTARHVYRAACSALELFVLSVHVPLILVIT